MITNVKIEIMPLVLRGERIAIQPKSITCYDGKEPVETILSFDTWKLNSTLEQIAQPIVSCVISNKHHEVSPFAIFNVVSSDPSLSSVCGEVWL